MLVVFASAARPGTSGAAESTFCRQSLAREVEPPFKDSRNLPVPPYGAGSLPIGSADVGIKMAQNRSLVLDGGAVGFALTNQRKRSVDVPADAYLRLTRVTRGGRILGVVRRRKKRIGTIDASGTVPLSFRVGARPSIFRVDVWFRGARGAKLGHYADYFRSAKRTVEVKLALGSEEYRPSETLTMRLEDLGTTTITFGEAFELQRFNGSEWMSSPFVPTAWPAELLGLGPGGIQDCQRFALPSDIQLGRYRALKKYRVAPKTNGRSRFASAEFDVVD